jgi:acid phosphatase (class A)
MINKPLLLFTVFLFNFCNICYPQEKNLEIPNHYKILSEVNAAPISGKEKIDNLIFDNWDDNLKEVNTNEFFLQFMPDSFFIPAPPANSSLQTAAELEYLLNLQNKRTRIDEERVLAVHNNNYSTLSIDIKKPENQNSLFFIGNCLGPDFNSQNLPVMAELLAKVQAEIHRYIIFYKLKYERVRPKELQSKILYLRNQGHENNAPEIIPITSAYPSGHAAFAFASAFVLMEIAPDLADKIWQEAFEYAMTREIAGLHYPSDTEASRKFCLNYFNKLIKESQGFREDLQRAKDEWQQKQPK